MLTRRHLAIHVLIPITAFCAGVSLHFFMPQKVMLQEQVDAALRETGTYSLTAPLLTCATTVPKDFGEYKSLHDSLEQIIQTAKAQGKASEVSVYFRGFGGKWVGINENVQYTPASLLKVPLMIAYFKQAESDPSILKKSLTYDGSFDGNKGESFHTEFDIKPGVYFVEDLIKAMVVNSDNNATTLLAGEIPSHSLSEIYTDLGLQIPQDNTPVAEVISAKEYSYFFRILYNATYLTPENSQKALELLTKANFPQGLQGGVPKDVTIAHKFGERTLVRPDGVVTERDLHDCGLIYYTKNPYLLCVMTKGKEFEDLSHIINDISKVVYDTQKHF